MFCYRKLGVSRYIVALIALFVVGFMSFFTIRTLVKRIKKRFFKKPSPREDERSDRKHDAHSLTGTPMKGVLDPDSDGETQEMRTLPETPDRDAVPSLVL